MHELQPLPSPASILAATSLGGAVAGTAAVTPPVAVDPCCPRHPMEALTLYCHTCRLSICKDCASDGNHRGHGPIVPVEKAARDARSILLPVVLPQLLATAARARSGVSVVRGAIDEVTTESARAEERLNTEITELVAAVQERRCEMLTELRGTRDAKIAMLQHQLDALERQHANAIQSGRIGLSLMVRPNGVPLGVEARVIEHQLDDEECVVEALGVASPPTEKAVAHPLHPVSSKKDRSIGTSEPPVVPIAFPPSAIADIAGRGAEFAAYMRDQRLEITPCVDPKVDSTLEPWKSTLVRQIRTIGRILSHNIAERRFVPAFAGAAVAHIASSPTRLARNADEIMSDRDGILYFFGCNRGTALYANPVKVGLVTVVTSSLGYGRPENVVAAERSPCCTQNVPNSWVCIDLASPVIVESYRICHDSTDTEAHFLRHWQLQGWNNDAATWVVLRDHVHDTTIHSAHPCGWWPIEQAAAERASNAGVEAPAPNAYKRLRIICTGVNSHQNNFLMLSAVEFYGLLLP